jgi:hypothetical protein
MLPIDEMLLVETDDYRERQEWWGGKLNTRSSDLYCKLVNPISFEIDNSSDDAREKSYYTALLQLCKDLRTWRVNVNNRGVWNIIEMNQDRYHVFKEKEGKKPRWKLPPFKNLDEMEKDPEILELARAASTDLYHYNFLKILLGFEGGVWGRPHINFAEYPIGTPLVSFEFDFYGSWSDFFEIRSQKTKYKWCHALWLPENYESIESAASFRQRLKERDKQ